MSWGVMIAGSNSIFELLDIHHISYLPLGGVD